MVTKTQVYEHMQVARSLFHALRDSDSPTDRANAEAYRLATQEWQEVALALDTAKAGGTPFDATIHLARLDIRWRHYLQTGQSHDSIDQLLREHARQNSAVPPPEEASLPAPLGSKGAKKGKLATAVAELAPDDPRRHVTVRMMNAIVDEFRQAFDMEIS